MGTLKYRDLFSIQNDFDVFLFDIWGVVIEGEHAYLEVVKNINKVIGQKKVFFITNAPRNAFSLCEKIQSWGVKAETKMIISSGDIAISTILDSKARFNIDNPVIYHLGANNNDILDGIKCDVTEDINKANILLLTIHCDGCYLLNKFDDLFRAAVTHKTINICANPDRGLLQHGAQRYCAGYFAERLEQLGGNVYYTGKPHEEIYNKVFDQIADVPKNRILMIGDTFHTDILGANKIGIKSALVLTGNAKASYSKDDSIDNILVKLKVAASEANVIPDFVIKLD